MARKRQFVAAMLGLGLACGLLVIRTTPLAVKANVPAPDTFATYAGGLGSGQATLLGQSPAGLAIHGTTLYIGDGNASIVRAVDLTTGNETVFAGGATLPGCGEPCPATQAYINPQGLATDSAGDVFIADDGQALRGPVRKVDLSGNISVFAGGGIGCTEPCPAVQQISVTPADITVDGSGNVFYTDSSVDVVHKVDGSGNITTVAGGGAGCTEPCLATSFMLGSPTGVAINSSGDIFISDTPDDVVRKVDHTTHQISIYAGGGGGCTEPCAAMTQFLVHPAGLAVDGSGNLYIAISEIGTVKKVDTGGTITTFAGGGPCCGLGDGGPATSAHMFSPGSLAFDGSGNLYISDFYGGRVRKVDHTTLNISTVAGNGALCGPAGGGGQAIDSQVCFVTGAAFDSAGNFYFTDNPNGVIRKITVAGVISNYAGGGAGCTEPCLATSSTLVHPNQIALNAAGDLFIADTTDNKIRKVDHATGDITTIAGTGLGTFGGDGGLATAAQLNQPNGVAVDSNGDVYIADTLNNRVRKIDHVTGDISTIAGNGSPGFTGDNGPGTSAQLNVPASVAVDAALNVYISDNNNDRIRKLSGGTITTFAGGGSPSCPVAAGIGDGLTATCASLQNPGQLSIDSAGRLYLIDHSRVRVIGTDGYISTVAGCLGNVDPNCPFQPVQGAPATQANMGPTAVAVDSTFNAFIGGSGPVFHLIYRVQAPLPPSAPTAVKATPGDSAATIRWTAGADNGNPTHKFTVTPFIGVTPQSPVVVTGLPVPTTITITGLTQGTVYTFQVKAGNAYGDSPATASNPVVPAAALAGQINTHAGSIGAGTATSLGQAPYAIAVSPNQHLYTGDLNNPVVRDVDTVPSDPTFGKETVVAGNDTYGYTGDGGQAIAATIQGAGAIASCPSDGTYIADTYNYVIRKIDGGGRITTVAGTGHPGYSGDNGPGTQAQIGRVFGLACRNGGGIYIADSDNGAVRILQMDGTIYTWWFGFSFPTGLTEMGSLDNVDVSDSSTNVVWNLSDVSACVTAGLASPSLVCATDAATSTQLNDPRGLLLYGNGQQQLYIADAGNNVVWAVTPIGTISKFAGTGIAGFSGDTGQATAARLNNPTGLAVQYAVNGNIGNDNIYIADNGNNRVRQVSVISGVITTIAGNGSPAWSGDGGPATQAQIGLPYGVAVDSAGNQYVVDNENNVIRKIDVTGTITTVAGNAVMPPGFSGDGGVATSAQLNDPRGVFVDSSGNIYIVDTGNNRIRKVDHATHFISTIAGTPVGGYNGDGISPTAAELNQPRGVVVDGSGNVFITDTGNNRIREISGGLISTYAGNGVAGFSGDGHPATAAQISGPRGIVIDPNGNVVFSDTENMRVRRIDHVTGNISTIAGDGVGGLAGDGHQATGAELNRPFGLAYDSHGNLFMADSYNQRIRMVDTNGIITTVVATCGVDVGFRGDGGPASAAWLDFPYGVAVDSFDNTYIADLGNNRVRGATSLAHFRESSCPGTPGTPQSRGASSSGGTAGTRTLHTADGGVRLSVRSLAAPMQKHTSGGLQRPIHPATGRPPAGGVNSSAPATIRIGGGGPAAPQAPATQGPATGAPPGSNVPAAATLAAPGKNVPWILLALVAVLVSVAVLAMRRRYKRRENRGEDA